MSNLLMLVGLPVSNVFAHRGDGAADLLTFDPKEVWQDSDVGTTSLDFDLGAVKAIDTVLLGFLLPPAAGATWTITGGPAGYGDAVIKAEGPLRAVDRAGLETPGSHGFWTGASASVRYIRLTVTQPGGSAPLSAGVFMTGAAFKPTWNKEWGSGRKPIDTGSATPLPGGGYAIVEGVRKGSYSFTLGDLTDAEVDHLYVLQLAVGETRPLLVVEDPDPTPGLLFRIHYGKLVSLRAYERRNPEQTRWEITIEDWV